MSVVTWTTGTMVMIREANVEKAYERLVALAAGPSGFRFSPRPFRFDSVDKIIKGRAASLADGDDDGAVTDFAGFADAERFQLRRERGVLTIHGFRDARLDGRFVTILETIAPWVEPSSYVKLENDADRHTLIVFDGKRMRIIEGCPYR